jgi:RecA-family ATPase
MLTLQILLQALGGKIEGGEVRAPGPGHSATDRSLCVRLSDTARDGFIVYSHTNDPPIECKDYVKEKLAQHGVKTNGASRAKSERASEETIVKEMAAAIDKQVRRREVTAYDYHDADGTLLYQHVRYEPKEPNGFSYRRPDGNGGSISNLDGIKRVAYRLPDLLQYPDAQVYLCEGEKDADRVESHKLCATSVESWTPDCIEPFRNRDVFILEDNDKGGRNKAQKAATALHGIARSVRIVRFSELPEKGDVSDWLDADKSRGADELYAKCQDAPLWTPTVETPTAKADVDNAPPLPPLQWVDMSTWDDGEPPPVDWAITDVVPRETVGLFSGVGGTGKTTTELLKDVAHVTGLSWFNWMPVQGPVIFVGCEDPENIWRIRLTMIARYFNTTFAELIDDGFHLMNLFGQDAVIFHHNGNKSGRIEVTPLYKQLYQAAGDLKPINISLDPLARIFSGSEVDRIQVYGLTAHAQALAQVSGGSVTLLSHPSLTGIKSGSGLAGSTAWHDAFRFRQYLRSPQDDDDNQPIDPGNDDGVRELVFMKNQYGAPTARLGLRYQRGLFLPESGINLEKLAAEAKAETAFLDALDRFTAQGRNLGATPTAPNYAPTLLAKQGSGITRTQFEAAMNRLFNTNKIRVEDYGRRTNSHKRLIRC